MPRTDVLKRVLARAAEELGPMVEKAQLARESFTLGEMESNLQVALKNLGVATLSTLCGLGQERHKKRVPGHADVGQGDHSLTFEGNREKHLNTLFGEIRFNRAYYHSESPQDSRWPRDEELGLKPGQIWSPGLQDVADYLATATGSYQAAAKSLLKTLRVEVQYKQIQRDCLDVGADLAAVLRQEAAEALEIKERPDPPSAGAGPACVILGVDGKIVGNHDGGPGMEVKIGRVDLACLQMMPKPKEADKPKDAVETPANVANDERQRELADLKDSREQREYKATTGLLKKALETAAPDRYDRPIYRPSNPTSHYRATAEKGTDIIGGLLWALAASLGVERAALVLFLADGAHWCWNLCETHFPGAIQILDVYHLAEHLLKAANTFWGESSDLAKPWALRILLEILRGNLDQVLGELAGLSFLEKSKREKLHELQTYLKNNSQRMDYPRYLAAGYPISSAMIEGACGHVIGERMSGSGKGWIEAGADAMARLRALYCSEQWDAFYKDRQKRIVESVRFQKRAA